MKLFRILYLGISLDNCYICFDCKTNSHFPLRYLEIGWHGLELQQFRSRCLFSKPFGNSRSNPLKFKLRFLSKLESERVVQWKEARKLSRYHWERRRETLLSTVFLYFHALRTVLFLPLQYNISCSKSIGSFALVYFYDNFVIHLTPRQFSYFKPRMKSFASLLLIYSLFYFRFLPQTSPSHSPSFSYLSYSPFSYFLV